jgi:hypothetical protein
MSIFLYGRTGFIVNPAFALVHQKFVNRVVACASRSDAMLLRLRRTEFMVPRAKLPALESEQLFEVTLEPQYGSPTGRPTGAILAVGRMVRL